MLYTDYCRKAHFFLLTLCHTASICSVLHMRPWESLLGVVRTLWPGASLSGYPLNLAIAKGTAKEKGQDRSAGRPRSLCSHHRLRNLCPFSVGKVFLSLHFSTLCEHSLLEKQKEGCFQRVSTFCFAKQTFEARNKSYLLKIRKRIKYRRKEHTK